jgi:serine/threonine protein kinase
VTDFRNTQRFKLIRRLGQGGMGAVFLVLDEERGTRVALKTLQKLHAESLLLFKNEFRALADIHHENLVSLYELVEDAGQWFFTMEWVQGTDFISYVRTTTEVRAGPADDEGATSDLSLNPVALDSPALDPPAPLGPTPAPALALNLPSSPCATPQSNSPSTAAAMEVSEQQLPHPGQLDEPRLRSALLQLGRGLGALHAANKIHRDIKPHELRPV